MARLSDRLGSGRWAKPKALFLLFSFYLLTCQSLQARCHIYRVWHYKVPQRCFTALAPIRKEARFVHLETFHEQISPRVPSIDLAPSQPHAPPWPTLEGIDWGHVGDERMEGIAKLRALANELW